MAPALVVIVKVFRVNVAVQVISLSSIVTLYGLAVPEQSPDQPVKVEPTDADAVTSWLVPYPKVPLPPTVPLPVLAGSMLTARLYWFKANVADMLCAAVTLLKT